MCTVPSSFPLTLTYKHVDNLSLHVDVYPPSLPQTGATSDKTVTEAPVVVYFHGGGLTVGNRKSWFPTWLQTRLCSSGVAFVSADYRLLVPYTGYDVLQDIKDLFAFVANELNPVLDEVSSSGGLPSFHIDSSRIAVAGTSAGGLCAYLSAIHASPKPIALLSMYGMGGNFMTDHYLKPKTKPFFRGREILNPIGFQEYLFPNSLEQPPISDSPLTYYGPEDCLLATTINPQISIPPTPGLPSNPRMFLTRLYLQQGSFLDYYTGDHKLSDALRPWVIAQSDDPSSSSLVPPTTINTHFPLFPQFGIIATSQSLSSSLSPSSSAPTQWPSTLLVHGELDTAVPVRESHHLKDRLKSAGIDDVSLKILKGQEHSFDYEPDADILYGARDGLFDEIAAFLVGRLR